MNVVSKYYQRIKIILSVGIISPLVVVAVIFVILMFAVLIRVQYPSALTAFKT